MRLAGHAVDGWLPLQNRPVTSDVLPRILWLAGHCSSTVQDETSCTSTSGHAGQERNPVSASLWVNDTCHHNLSHSRRVIVTERLVCAPSAVKDASPQIDLKFLGRSAYPCCTGRCQWQARQSQTLDPYQTLSRIRLDGPKMQQVWCWSMVKRLPPVRAASASWKPRVIRLRSERSPFGDYHWTEITYFLSVAAFPLIVCSGRVGG